MTLEIVILAAGKGSRMKSDLPKVLHTLAGKSLLEHVLTVTDQLKPMRIHIVIGHQGEQVKTSIESCQIEADLNWVIQQQQLGTGHAVAQALPDIDPESTVLIMAGDVPLIEPSTLIPLCELKADINLLTAELVDPSGLGRIIRQGHNGPVTAIVEHKDASEVQRTVREINTGVMAARATDLADWLSRVKNNNAQNEYYLPDIIALAVSDDKKVNACVTDDAIQVTGINSRVELARLERQYQTRIAQQLMKEGVGLADPGRIDVRGRLNAGEDCFIDINCLFEQTVKLGNRVHIGPNVIIRNSEISDDCRIEANSMIDNAMIAQGCNVGPFARIRPDTQLLAGSRIGNFVEIKKTIIGKGSKVNHLSYVGDSLVGERVNIGAGVITCNYDGAYKHQTVIGDDAFVGSDCQLIAPVEIGSGATIGAGSTIRKNAPHDQLTLTHSKQVSVKGWRRPAKSLTK